MRNPILFALTGATAAVIGLSAFRAAGPQESPKYMHITTIESIIPGGLGRSRVITTQPDGTQQMENLENFYSLAGINFANIQSNEKFIITRLNQLEADGWHLTEVTAGTQSPSEGFAQGIYMTRYLLKK